MATQKKRKAPRAPFIVTVSAVSFVAFAALPGCGTVTSNPPPPDGVACPDADPSIGGACDYDGQSCTYGTDECGNPIDYACANGEWTWGPGTGTCNPPPPECPAEAPAQGAPCDEGWDGPCFYTVDTGCGPVEAQATCFGGQWDVPLPTCNPPPPEYCYTLATEDECALNGSFCRWEVPGCAEPGSVPPALPQAGCHPSFDCISDGECLAGSTCQEVVINPCYNDVCDACGATAMLCVATP